MLLAKIATRARIVGVGDLPAELEARRELGERGVRSRGAPRLEPSRSQHEAHEEEPGLAIGVLVGVEDVAVVAKTKSRERGDETGAVAAAHEEGRRRRAAARDEDEDDIAGQSSSCAARRSALTLRDMRLEGSCSAKRSAFRVESETPSAVHVLLLLDLPQDAPAASFGCNVMGVRATLQASRAARTCAAITRASAARASRRRSARASAGSAARAARTCWVADKRWPEGVWPNAGAIDTPLPRAPAHVFMMTRYKPDWVPLDGLGEGPRYPEYPELSIAAWHEQNSVKEPLPPPPKAARRGAHAPRKRARAAAAAVASQARHASVMLCP